MKFNKRDIETTQEYNKRIKERALANLGIKEISDTEIKERHDIRHEVSRLLLNDDIRGRPNPMSKNKINPTRVRCNRKINYNTYPRKLKTDKQKFFYLKDLLLKNEIPADIFIDLAEVLDKVRLGTINRLVKLHGQTIGSSNIMEAIK